MKVDVGAVLEGGREVELHADIELADFGAFTFPRPSHVDLDIRRLGSNLAIVGNVEAAYGGACERCLEEVERPLRIEVNEALVPRSAWGLGAADPTSEDSVLHGTILDVGDLVRQLADAALPLVNLCSDGCAGLCAQCGQKTEACTCGPDPGGNDGKS